MKTNLISTVIGILLLIGGCVTSPILISPKYQASSKPETPRGDSTRVDLQIRDERGDTSFYQGGPGSSPDLFMLTRSPKQIFTEGFTEALQTRGYQLHKDADIKYSVSIKRFLVELQFGAKGIGTDIVLDVAVKGVDQILSKRTIFDRDTEKRGLFQPLHEVIPVVLSRSLSRAIEKAVKDPYLSAAIKGASVTATEKLKALSESLNVSDISKMRELIDAGADVNVANKKSGYTPLHQAAQKGYWTSRVINASHVLAHTNWATAVAFSPDSRFAITGSGNGIVHLWSVDTGKELHRFEEPEQLINTVAFSQDGSYIAAGGYDQTIYMWNLSKLQLVRRFEGHKCWINSVAFSSDDQRIVSSGGHSGCSSGGSVRVWDIATGRGIYIFETQSVANSATFSLDGQSVFFWSNNEKDAIIRWEPETDSQKSFSIGTIMQSVAFSPDGKLALSGEGGYSEPFGAPTWTDVLVWDIAAGREIGRFEGHVSPVFAVAFSPDKQLALSGSGDTGSQATNRPVTDCVMRLWEIKSGQEIAVFVGHKHIVRSVALSPDGRYALSGSFDGTARLWKLPLFKKEIERLRAISAMEKLKSKKEKNIARARESSEDTTEQTDSLFDKKAEGKSDDLNFVERVQSQLAHQIPEDASEGLWLATVPRHLDVFAFPSSVRDLQKHSLLRSWTQGDSLSPYHLGKTPLHVVLKPGSYKLVFVHPPIPDDVFQLRYHKNTFRRGLETVDVELPVFPFIAPSGGGYVFAGDKSNPFDGVSWPPVTGDYFYWIQERDFTTKPELSTMFVLFQRWDQSISSLLKDFPDRHNFLFTAGDQLRNLSIEERSLYLTEKEVAEVERALRIGGVWVKRFDAQRSLSLEVQENGGALARLHSQNRAVLYDQGRFVGEVGVRKKVATKQLAPAQKLLSTTSTVISGTPEPINAEATEKLKALSESMDASDITKIRTLIDAGADVNVANKKSGYTPLHEAAQKGHKDIVSLLLESNADVNVANKKSGITPLLIASGNGHTEIVELLLSANADVNANTKSGITPLLMASQNGHTEIVNLLLAANADVDVADKKLGTTPPLHLASQNGHTEIVKLLLSANADVNAARKMDGTTPLYIASQSGYTEIVKLLLEAKADVDAANKDGSTPLRLASQNGHTEIVKLLLAANADVNAAGKMDGITPLFKAAQKGHTDIVKLLLKEKADVNAADKKYGFTPLFIASTQGHTEIVRLLLAVKADVNVADKIYGATPLHIAVQKGHIEIVKLLLAAKADVNVVSKDGTTPLSMAIGMGRRSIAKLLHKYGAKY